MLQMEYTVKEDFIVYDLHIDKKYILISVFPDKHVTEEVNVVISLVFLIIRPDNRAQDIVERLLPMLPLRFPDNFLLSNSAQPDSPPSI